MSHITRERLIALSKTNLLGSQVNFQDPPSLATGGPPQSTQLISLAGDVGDAGPWTITLAGPFLNFIAGAGIQVGAGLPDLFARITYGVGDAMQIVDVDWCHGAQITVFGSQISVQAINPFNSPPAYRCGPISASIAPGVRPDGRPNQRTIRFNETGLPNNGDIAAGVTAEVVIPPMARRCRHTCVASASLARTLTLLDPQGNVTLQMTYTNSTGRIFPQWGGGDEVIITRTAARVALTNNDAALAIARAAIVFDLAV